MNIQLSCFLILWWSYAGVDTYVFYCSVNNYHKPEQARLCSLLRVPQGCRRGISGALFWRLWARSSQGHSGGWQDPVPSRLVRSSRCLAGCRVGVTCCSGGHSSLLLCCVPFNFKASSGGSSSSCALNLSDIPSAVTRENLAFAGLMWLGWVPRQNHSLILITGGENQEAHLKIWPITIFGKRRGTSQSCLERFKTAAMIIQPVFTEGLCGEQGTVRAWFSSARKRGVFYLLGRAFVRIRNNTKSLERGALINRAAKRLDCKVLDLLQVGRKYWHWFIHMFCPSFNRYLLNPEQLGWDRETWGK